jgi:hypothetical protein
MTYSAPGLDPSIASRDGWIHFVYLMYSGSLKLALKQLDQGIQVEEKRYIPHVGLASGSAGLSPPGTRPDCRPTAPGQL